MSTKKRHLLTQLQMLGLAHRIARPQLLLLLEQIPARAPAISSTNFESVRALRAAGLWMLVAEQHVRCSPPFAHRRYVLEHGRPATSGGGAQLPADPQSGAAYLGN